MLTPDQIHRRALSRYPEFLRSLCSGDSIFPLIVLGAGMAKPSDFTADRDGIRLLQSQSKEQAGFGYEITWKEKTFRRLGAQRIPGTVAFTTQEDYVRFLKKQSEVRQFVADCELIQHHCPELRDWVRDRPVKVVAHAGVWQELLNVCIHLRHNPRPNCYLRELPVVVDTKFIESHKGILCELLPIAAPQTVGPDASSFESWFGFRLKQPLVRMRFLDAALANRYGFPVDDFAIPLDTCCNCRFGNSTVLIVENEMTFLTLPHLPGTIVLFGAGDAAALLAAVGWLESCRVFYWGDLDSHGFETLSNLRRTFPRVSSILMDESTYSTHSVFAVSASPTRATERLNLNPAELALYETLVEKGKLLEQERIHCGYSTPRLTAALVG
jgi:hypothetical protein